MPLVRCCFDIMSEIIGIYMLLARYCFDIMFKTVGIDVALISRLRL